MNKKNEIIKEYYIVVFLLQNERHSTLWYTEDVDGFVLDETSTRIRTFTNEEKAKEFAIKKSYDLQNGITEINCRETTLLNYDDVNCDMLLTFWNIISDVARSINVVFLGDCKEGEIKKLYSKLFFGCNLQAMRKEGENYIPKWSQSEIELLTRIVKEGLEILYHSFSKKRN